jgi:hypothetical protein
MIFNYSAGRVTRVPSFSQATVILAGSIIAFASSSAILCGAEIRIGIIGTDTSHAVAFTENLNNPQAKGHVSGGRIVAAFKGGSSDIPSSANRVEEYSKTLRNKYGVTLYDSIEEMCQNVDAICLESVDGRPHLEQFKAILRAQKRETATRGAEMQVRGGNVLRGAKPVFIDKPMGGSLADVLEIFKLANDARVPIFSSSSLRFAKDTQAVHHGSIDRVTLVEAYGPCELERHHPDLFWYGVHGVEALFTILGPDCISVQRGKTADGKIEATGYWSGGRKGVFREDANFHGKSVGEKGTAPSCSFDGYVPLVTAIMEFFQTRVPPVDAKETIRIFAFMEGADLSKKNGDIAASLDEVIKSARSKARKN